jgi:uncharacterized protein YuzE
MALTVREEPLQGGLPNIAFAWDPETEILAGRFAPSSAGRGLTGSVGYEGGDGTFLLMEVEQGTVCGIEVVVWPDVAVAPDLVPPADPPQGTVVVPARPSQPGIGSVEIDAALSAEGSPNASVIRLRLGPRRPTHVVRIADTLCVEVDDNREIAGFWLLNVPPFPEDT